MEPYWNRRPGMFQSWRQLVPLVIAGLLMWGLIFGAWVVACGGELESSYTFEADPEQIIDWDAQPFTIEFDADEIIWPESWECMSLRITDPRFPIGPGIRPRYIKVCGPVVEVEQ